MTRQRTTQKKPKRTNAQKAKADQDLFKRFTSRIKELINSGIDAESAHRKTSHSYRFFGAGTNPIYTPNKHPKMTPAAQQRAARKRRRAK